LTIVHEHGALEHNEGERAALGDRKFSAMPAVEPHVPDIDGSKGVGRSAVAAVIARDHTHSTGTVGQINRGDRRAAQTLVSRRRHLVFGRQVDP
jgi:hypothetical protein